MMKVFEPEQNLLVESPLNRLGRLAVIANEMSGPEKPHRARRFVFLALSLRASLCSDTVNSSWLAKRP
jgi:hypothetical protein